jgi:hypothetical protein
LLVEFETIWGLSVALFLTPFLLLSVVGLVLSLIVHIHALLGQPQPLGPATWCLHVGIFVVWLPTVLVSNQLKSYSSRKEFWKAVFRGCPTWMRWLTYAFMGYAVGNFLLFLAVMPPKGAGAGANASPEVIRGFSGHWMAFYMAGAAAIYSAIAVSASGVGARRALGPD